MQRTDLRVCCLVHLSPGGDSELVSQRASVVDQGGVGEDNYDRGGNRGNIRDEGFCEDYH